MSPVPGALRPLHGSGFAPDEVELGHLQGVFGVRGELKVWLDNPASDLFRQVREVVVVSPEGRRFSSRLSVRSGAGRRLLGRIEGLDDRDVAASLSGWRFGLAVAALPTLPSNEFYVRDLLGCAVEIEGRPCGVVEDVQDTHGGDVLVVRTAADLSFVPLVKAWIVQVDLPARRIVLAPGALDEP